MQLSQVEGINAFFSTHQYVLITSLWVNPRCSAVDFQWTAIENLKENIKVLTQLEVCKNNTISIHMCVKKINRKLLWFSKYLHNFQLDFQNAFLIFHRKRIWNFDGNIFVSPELPNSQETKILYIILLTFAVSFFLETFILSDIPSEK